MISSYKHTNLQSQDKGNTPPQLWVQSCLPIGIATKEPVLACDANMHIDSHQDYVEQQIIKLYMWILYVYILYIMIYDYVCVCFAWGLITLKYNVIVIVEGKPQAPKEILDSFLFIAVCWSKTCQQNRPFIMPLAWTIHSCQLYSILCLMPTLPLTTSLARCTNSSWQTHPNVKVYGSSQGLSGLRHYPLRKCLWSCFQPTEQKDVLCPRCGSL